MIYLLAALLLTTPAGAAEPYDQRWNEIMEDLHAMETGLAINQPRSIRTEKIRPDPAKTGERVAQEPAKLKPRSIRKSNNQADVCQRVGRRKVMVGRYRWKCR